MSALSSLINKLKGEGSEEQPEKAKEEVEEEHPDHDSEEDEDICQFC